MISGSGSAIHLDVQPLAPTPELFLRTVRRILDSPDLEQGSYVSLHLTPVFPFQDRGDGLAYDEKVFSQLFSGGDRIAVRIYLDHPFWIPGKQDWRLGLDERGEDAFPFLSARLSETISDFLSLSGAGIRAVELVSDLPVSIRYRIEERLYEDLSGSELEIFWLAPPAMKNKGGNQDRDRNTNCLIPILPGRLWLEQLQGMRLTHMFPDEFQHVLPESQYPDFPGLRSAWENWTSSIPGGLFHDSAALINSLQRGSARDLWPFSSMQSQVQSKNSDGVLESSYRRLEDELNRSLKPLIEEAWYGRFMMTMDLVQRRMLQAQELG